MEDVVKLSEGEIIAVDGRTHRRSYDREKTKISYRKKRLRAALNDTFRHKLLIEKIILYTFALERGHDHPR